MGERDGADGDAGGSDGGAETGGRGATDDATAAGTSGAGEGYPAPGGRKTSRYAALLHPPRAPPTEEVAPTAAAAPGPAP